MDAQSASLAGVARSSKPSITQEDTELQVAYELAFAEQSKQLGAAIESGQIKNLSALWASCRTACRELQKHQERPVGGPHETQTGSQRSDPRGHRAITPLQGPDDYLQSIAFLPDKEGSATRLEQLADGKLGEGPIPPDTHTYQRDSLTKINGDLAELTSAIAFMKENEVVAKAHVTIEPLGEVSGVILHTKSYHIPLLMQEANAHYKKLTTLSTTLSKEDALKELAHMHWLLAQATPDKEDNAAKTELAVRATARAINLELPPLRHGVQPYTDAFLFSREDFVEHYSKNFEKPSTQRSECS